MKEVLKKSVEKLVNEQSEEALWECVVAFQNYRFRTYSGLLFSYLLKKGMRSGIGKKYSKGSCII